MPLFYIEAIDNEGNKLKRFIKLDKEDELFPFFEFSGYIPIKIKKLPKIFSYLNIQPAKIKRRDIIEVLENLHLIVKSGLPLNTGLMDLAKDIENPALKDMLMDIAFKVQLGYSLSTAVEKYRQYFTDVVVSLFKIGEETGSLDKTLKDASEHLKKIEELKSRAKQALIYPSFAFVAILGALIFWLVFVLPKMVIMFKEFGVSLPFTTKLIIYASEFTQKYIVSIIAVIIALIFITILLRKYSKRFKYITDRIILKLPVFGVIITNFNYAFFTEYIRLMITAGLPLYQSLEIMAKAMNNEVFKKAIENAREKVGLGISFSQALKEENLFSSLIIRMINVGEQTGQLDNQLKYISDYYYAKVDYLAQNIAKMIEPIMIGILGFFLMILVVGLLGPIYQLISKIGG